MSTICIRVIICSYIHTYVAHLCLKSDPLSLRICVEYTNTMWWFETQTGFSRISQVSYCALTGMNKREIISIKIKHMKLQQKNDGLTSAVFFVFQGWYFILTYNNFTDVYAFGSIIKCAKYLLLSIIFCLFCTCFWNMLIKSIKTFSRQT